MTRMTNFPSRSFAAATTVSYTHLDVYKRQVLAFIGILLYMGKSEKRKGVGTILIGLSLIHI